MKKTEKAILLSILVFPGSGHLFLKRYVLGSLLIIVALISSYFVISEMIISALDLADKIKRGEVPPDIFLIKELLLKKASGGEFQLINMSVNVLICVWLIGILDSFRIVKSINKRKV